MRFRGIRSRAVSKEMFHISMNKMFSKIRYLRLLSHFLRACALEVYLRIVYLKKVLQDTWRTLNSADWNNHIAVMSHECHSISNHWSLDCLLNSLLRLTSKKTSTPVLLAFCEGNPQKDSNMESVCMSWHVMKILASEAFVGERTLSNDLWLSEPPSHVQYVLYISKETSKSNLSDQ